MEWRHKAYNTLRSLAELHKKRGHPTPISAFASATHPVKLPNPVAPSLRRTEPDSMQSPQEKV